MAAPGAVGASPPAPLEDIADVQPAPPPVPPPDCCGESGTCKSKPPAALPLGSQCLPALLSQLNPFRTSSDTYDALDGNSSIPELNSSVEVPVAREAGATRRSVSDSLRTLWAYAGPGLLISVGYMDPGNWSTDIAGGSAFGYDLLFVVLVANLMAMVLQALSVRLGAGASRDLAQACREQYPRPVAVFLWIAAECAIAATDMAEVIGTAIALQILFGLPLAAGVVLTAADVLILLAVAGRSARGLESLILALLAVICGCFVFTLAKAAPPAREVMSGFIPRKRIFTNAEELYIGAGILGATVMPHNLYLHSALVQSRGFGKDVLGRREAIAYATVDSTIALLIAGFVNAAILIVAADAFAGRADEVATLQDAAEMLAPALGSGAATKVFAIGLLAAGQQSTLTGTLAGQVVMEGFLGPGMALKPWARRLATRLVAIVPAVAVAASAGDAGAARLLNASQVVLSLQLPFAVFPLVQFTGSRAVVGDLATRWPLRALAWAIFAAVSAINVKLVIDFASGSSGGH